MNWWIFTSLARRQCNMPVRPCWPILFRKLTHWRKLVQSSGQWRSNFFHRTNLKTWRKRWLLMLWWNFPTLTKSCARLYVSNRQSHQQPLLFFSKTTCSSASTNSPKAMCLGHSFMDCTAMQTNGSVHSSFCRNGLILQMSSVWRLGVKSEIQRVSVPSTGVGASAWARHLQKQVSRYYWLTWPRISTVSTSMHSMGGRVSFPTLTSSSRIKSQSTLNLLSISD